VGYPGGERRIVNVADGLIELGSTDAVNGGQLADALGALSTRAGILEEVAPNFAIDGVTGDNTASLDDNDPDRYTAMAFGVKSLASGADAAAFGLNNTAAFDYSVAIGVNCGTGADKRYSVAIGSKATTRGSYAIGVGAYVDANADYAVAIGTSSGSTSIDRTQALGVSSIAIGDTAKDLGASGIAIGKSASVATRAISCIAMGTGANVATDLSDAIALGTGASVAAGANNGGVALGQGALANRGNAVSLGSTTGSTPVGTRQIIHLSAGTQATDAVNVTQLQGLATALGGGAGVGSDGSIMPPTYTVDGTPYANVGAAINAVANLTDPNAVSYDDTAKDTITLDGDDGTLLTNVSPGSVATDSTDAINGTQLYGTAQSMATGMGGGAAVAADGTVTPPSYVTGTLLANDVGGALDNVLTVVNNQLADAGLVDADTGRAMAAVTYDGASKNRVTLGGTDATSEVTLSNVAPGDALSDTSTEAVNGAQLYATNQAIADLAQAVDESGIVDADGNSLAVTYVDATHTDIELGTTGTPVTVSNVKAGDASSDTSTEAVNGAQLFATNQAIADLAQAVDESGIVDADGNSLAVTYVDATHTDIELGTTGTPVALHNMATGVDGTDGVNVAQLAKGLTDLRSDLSSGAINLKYIKVNATGTQANANGTNAVSIGSNATATAYTAVAIGTGASASGEHSVAVGYNSVADADDVFSVGFAGGERKIVNVAEGQVTAFSTDAVTGGQLFAVRKALDALAANSVAANSAKNVEDDPQGAIEGRSGKNVASLNGGDPEKFTAVALGVFSFANGSDAIAVGLDNVAGADRSVALGRRARTGADNDSAVAIGADVQTNAPHAVALGTRVQANAEHALAVGSRDTWAVGKSSIAMGEGAKVRADRSIAIGRAAVVATDAVDALALGAEASVEAGAIGGVALGHGAVADRGNAISIGGGTVGTRQIIHVAAGKEPTDAVNVAQLKEAMAAMMAEIQLLRSQLASRG
jgi:autotransporter adhesin